MLLSISNKDQLYICALKRFFARFVDVFILIPIYLVISYYILMVFNVDYDTFTMNTLKIKIAWKVYFLTNSSVLANSFMCLYQIFLCLLGMLIEASMISKIGSTPGKILFGIKVVDYNNNLLPFFKAFKRSFKVTTNGAGFYFYSIGMITLIYSCVMFIMTRNTSWDKAINCVVQYKKLSKIHISICFIVSMIIFAVLFLSVYEIIGSIIDIS